MAFVRPDIRFWPPGSCGSCSIFLLAVLLLLCGCCSSADGGTAGCSGCVGGSSSSKAGVNGGVLAVDCWKFIRVVLQWQVLSMLTVLHLLRHTVSCSMASACDTVPCCDCAGLHRHLAVLVLACMQGALAFKPSLQQGLAL
jgi:hypothetical protein